MITIIVLSIIGWLLCMGISIYIFFDKEGYYLAGGAAESGLLFFLAFVPFGNFIIGMMILVVYVFQKLRGDV